MRTIFELANLRILGLELLADLLWGHRPGQGLYHFVHDRRGRFGQGADVEALQNSYEFKHFFLNIS